RVAPQRYAVYFMLRLQSLWHRAKEKGKRGMRAASCWLLVLGVSLVTGCGWVRLYPPVAFVERTAPISPDARPRNCKLRVLSAPPSEPYEVFAQVVSYGGSAEMAEEMQ